MYITNAGTGTKAIKTAARAGSSDTIRTPWERESTGRQGVVEQCGHRAVGEQDGEQGNPQFEPAQVGDR